MTKECTNCGRSVFEYQEVDHEKLKRVYYEMCVGCGKKSNVTKEEELSDDELKRHLKTIDKNKPLNISHKRMWKLYYGAEYDYKFLEYLKTNLSKRGKLLEQSTITNGFFYVIDNVIVWEIPKYGNATYFFQGSVTFILPQISQGIFSKSDILNDNQLIKIIGFKGKVNHNYDDFKGWKTRIDEIQESIFAK
ncbi:MAG: hypothetical protein KAH86_05330 [Methanosarcinales archaeon]|nr:hypothetical protein [Methanosarcinales archaeon]